MKLGILSILFFLTCPLLAEAAPSLAITGECPGVVTTRVTDVTPNNRFAVFTGTEGGTHTFGGGPCAGATLDLGSATFLRRFAADASGSAELSASLPMPACGNPMQVLDMIDCSVSNVASNPVVADNDGDGFSEADGDCDDGNEFVHPAAVEVCDNGVDDDCDGSVDTDVFIEDNFDSGSPSSLVINGDGYHGYIGKDGYISLTEDIGSQMTTVFTNGMVDGNSFNIGVEVYLGSNTGGADGMAIIIADSFSPWYLNGYKRADAFGVNGLGGYAITLDTYENLESGDPGANFIGLAELGSHPYPYIATNNTIPTLEDGNTHYVEISMDHGMIEVFLDGVSYINAEIPGYALDNAMIGFAGATGGLTNYHSMDDLYIGCEAQTDYDDTIADVQPIFDKHCTSCHSGKSPSSGLDLSSGNAHTNTVNVLSSTGMILVADTGVPDESYLWHKVMGTHMTVGGAGDQMPRGAAPLSSDDLDVIESWLWDGALP